MALLLGGGPTLSTCSSSTITPRKVSGHPSTVIFPILWKGNMKDTFLATELAPNIMRLVNHPDNFPNLVISHLT
jgi:hypothetical protein